MIPFLSIVGVCPSCQSQGRALRILGATNRCWSKTCKNCEKKLVSNIGILSYTVFMIYTLLVAAVVGVPLLLGIVTGDWLMAAGAAVLMAGLIYIPAMALHAAYLRVED